MAKGLVSSVDSFLSSEKSKKSIICALHRKSYDSVSLTLESRGRFCVHSGSKYMCVKGCEEKNK